MVFKKSSRALSPTQRGKTRRDEQIARWVILLYSLGAAMALVAWILAPFRKARGRTWWEILFHYVNIPVTHSLASALVMLIVASALMKRRRVALYAVIVFQALGILLSFPGLAWFFSQNAAFANFKHTFNPLWDISSNIIAVLAIVLLWRTRSAFPARIPRSNWKNALVVVGLGVAVTVVLAMVFGDLTHRSMGQSQVSTTRWGLRYLLIALGAPLPPHVVSMHATSTVYREVIEVVFALVIILTVLVALRTSRDSKKWTPQTEVKLRRLVHQYGGQDSLSYFATRREKSVVFSDDGQAAVTYRLVSSVCLASGDPVGATSSWESAITNWKKYARTYGWNLGSVSVSENGAKAYAAAGLSITYMGDEAILLTDRFTLNSTSLNDVRHAYQRLSAEGFTVKVRTHRALSDADMLEVIAQTDQWRHGSVERGFSMALNRLGDPADGRCYLVSTHNAAGEMVGMLSFVPWGKTGVSLDVMRRSPTAPNGTVEFMVAGLMEQAPEFGIKRVSLNFAMFRKTFLDADHFGASPWTRAASSTLGFFDRYLQLERLYRFNQKFDPLWEPRYLAAESLVTLPQVSLAAGRAEGFLPSYLSGKLPAEQHLDTETLAQIQEIERQQDIPQVSHKYTDQTKHRIRHLQQLREAGMNPYPVGQGNPLGVRELAVRLESLSPVSSQPDDASKAGSRPSLCVAGRVRAIRSFGSVVFLEMIEGSTTAQVVCERERFVRAGTGLSTQLSGDAGVEAGAILPQPLSHDIDLLRHAVDTGDILIFSGVLGCSRNGTPSLLATGWAMGSKSLHAIPFGNFTDPESRLRRRSTDLLVNAEQVEYLRMRTSIITSIRATLDGGGFTEVETPILNTIHGGASARPFKTFINAYGAELYLRIAPELYLKRLVVGGMGAVYELGRDFRNEGADATHNPEFTVLEAYKPFADYNTMREVTEALIKNAARSVFGQEALPLGEKGAQERTLTSVAGPWPVKTVCGALSEAVGQEISLETDFEVLLGLAHEHEIYVRDDMGAGAVIEELYGELVEANTVFPTFYTDFPVETSPLAGAHRTEPGLAERWDLVINGMELGTAYSEMADALEQRRRLTEQSLKAAAGDLEAMEIDEDFLYALETGLPPTGGLGIGIDRLVMLMAGTQIRGVLTFPFVKPAGN